MIELIAAGLSDVGPVRANNEDCIGSHAPTDPLVGARKGHLFVLADGVGGQNAGEVASATAVETIIAEYYSPSNHTRIEPALKQSVQAANLRIYNLAQRHVEYRQMATTVSVLAVAGAHAYIAHVGDSRIYLWRDGRLTQLTDDHSEVAELVRMRIISRGKMRDHPRRNVLTRALGGRLILRPDFVRQPLQPGDQLIQCTDGLWAEVADEEIAEVLGECEPDLACRRLIQRAVDHGTEDNVSLQVVRVLATSDDPQPQNGRSGWLADIFQRINRS
ncbi:MAG: family protein phosphatase [Chloroflexota bacterium]|jgi:protein phosphatase|nr:family protein phosphatase [Chloroflexota bacterium]